MRRGAKPAKAKGDAKLPVARKSGKNESSLVRDLEKRLTEALEREAEGLEQQTATSEILGVISSSPANAQPVFDAIAVNALRLYGADGAVVVRYDGTLLHLAAHHNVNPEAVARLEGQYPVAPDRHLPMGQAVLDGAVVHVPDLQAAVQFPGSVARQFGARSHVSIPLLHQGRAIGAIGISRLTLGSFSDRQIALLQTFANQAVIAIENVRLFNETKEALERETATSEILRVISSSPTDVQPVFDTIVASAVRLCEARFGALYRFDGELTHLAAHHNLTSEVLEILQRLYPARPTRGQASGRAILSRAVAELRDVPTDAEYQLQEFAAAGGWRSMLAVPMLRNDGSPIGAIVIYRSEAGPFPEQHLKLLKTFADQAVIAIENVRLFTELQEKNQALALAHEQVSESLEQQTATSEILRVIAGSPTDVQPSFDAIAAAAATLCAAHNAGVFLFDGTLIHLAAHHHWTTEDLDAMQRTFPRPPGRGSITSRAIAPYKPLDKDTEYSIEERPGGFRISVNRSHYQFFPDFSEMRHSCRSAVTSVAHDIAAHRGRRLRSISEERVRVDTSRNGFTGISYCPASVTVDYE